MPAAPGPLRLYLVRHGETVWSVSGQHTGRTDIALTTRGEDEARALAPVLRDIRFDRVFASPAQRARRTCALAGFGAAAEIEPDLAEWHYGDFEGRRSAEIRMASPDWSVYRDGCPGGESPEDICRRADRLLESLKTMGGTIALFSHGQFGCSLGARWIGSPLSLAQHLQLDTASFSILGFSPRHPGVPTLERWNISPTMRP